MRKTYWHKHPRNFANECEMVYATTQEQMGALEKKGFERLSVTQVRRHIRWLNAENAAWGSGRAIGDYRFDDIESCAELLSSCQLYSLSGQ